jgi:hypothetical protein
MKRSEALAEIAFILDTERDLDNPDKSDLILKKLEEMGMLPPFAHLKNLGILDTAWESEE